MKSETSTIHLLAFGMIAEVFGHAEMDWAWTGDTSSLRAELIRSYPELNGLPFAIAVNMDVAVEEQPIPPGATIALLPPYSGG